MIDQEFMGPARSCGRLRGIPRWLTRTYRAFPHAIFFALILALAPAMVVAPDFDGGHAAAMHHITLNRPESSNAEAVAALIHIS